MTCYELFGWKFFKQLSQGIDVRKAVAKQAGVGNMCTESWGRSVLLVALLGSRWGTAVWLFHILEVLGMSRV